MSVWAHATDEDWIGGQDHPDGSDITEVLDGLGEKLHGRVVEIGCGTGRLSQLCEEYVGYDISPSYVEIARSRGVDARLTPVPADEHGDWLILAHVLCHLSREDRLAYLALEIAPRLLVDHIPGEGIVGYPPIYLLSPEDFLSELEQSGWVVAKGPFELPETDFRHIHRYYVCEK